MTELLALLGDYWFLAPVLLLLLGFVPDFLLRQLVRLYPSDDPRRRELIAEMRVLGRFRKWEWLGETLSTALGEGLPRRLRERRIRRENASLANNTVDGRLDAQLPSFEANLKGDVDGKTLATMAMQLGELAYTEVVDDEGVVTRVVHVGGAVTGTYREAASGVWMLTKLARG